MRTHHWKQTNLYLKCKFIKCITHHWYLHFVYLLCPKPLSRTDAALCLIAGQGTTAPPCIVLVQGEMPLAIELENQVLFSQIFLYFYWRNTHTSVFIVHDSTRYDFRKFSTIKWQNLLNGSISNLSSRNMGEFWIGMA